MNSNSDAQSLPLTSSSFIRYFFSGLIILIILSTCVIISSFQISDELLGTTENTVPQWKKTIAYYHLLSMAKFGDSISQYNLALMYLKGNIIPKDDKLFLYWTTRAAQQGSVDAQYNLALAYLKEYAGLKTDPKMILDLLEKSAPKHHESAAILGSLYLSGKILPHDDQRGCYWSSKAAEFSLAGAEYNLGVCYLEGKGGLAKNKDQALLWLQKAAAKNILPAQTLLSQLATKPIIDKQPKLHVAEKTLDEGMVVDFDKDLPDDPKI